MMAAMRLPAALLCLAAACSSASESPPAGPRTSALFVIGRDAADGAIATDVSTTLVRLGKGASVDLLAGASLGEKLGADATSTIQGCGADLGCIGGLADRAGAREVIFGRVASLDPSGVRVQFLSIRAGSDEIDRRVQLDLASRDEIDQALHGKFEAITGAALASDVAEPEIPTGRPAVARCEATEGQVRVRRARSLSWERLGKGMELFVGDLVETAPTATARIDYSSGSSIDVAPASVIVLEEAADDGKGEVVEHIAIRSGVVRGRVQEDSRRVVVHTPDGERVDLEPAQGSGELNYRVSARKESAIEVAVSKGTGVLTASRGPQRTIKAGRVQDIKAGTLVGEAEELPEFPKLLVPGVDATMQADVELRIDLKWGDAPRASTYHVQVAGDPSFQKLFVDEMAGTTSWSFPPPAHGTYYWRVATRNADGREGEFGFARRLYVTPEQINDLLVSPVSGATLSFGARAPRFVTFSWRAAVPPAPYVLIVSKDEKIDRAPVLSIVTTSQEVMTRQLADGDYWWGVYIERSGKRKPIFTKPNKLTVMTKEH
jgi:hypothetical protein